MTQNYKKRTDTDIRLFKWRNVIDSSFFVLCFHIDLEKLWNSFADIYFSDSQENRAKVFGKVVTCGMRWWWRRRRPVCAAGGDGGVRCALVVAAYGVR